MFSAIKTEADINRRALSLDCHQNRFKNLRKYRIRGEFPVRDRMAAELYGATQMCNSSPERGLPTGILDLGSPGETPVVKLYESHIGMRLWTRTMGKR